MSILEYNNTISSYDKTCMTLMMHNHEGNKIRWCYLIQAKLSKFCFSSFYAVWSSLHLVKLSVKCLTPPSVVYKGTGIPPSSPAQIYDKKLHYRIQ